MLDQRLSDVNLNKKRNGSPNLLSLTSPSQLRQAAQCIQFVVLPKPSPANGIGQNDDIAVISIPIYGKRGAIFAAAGVGIIRAPAYATIYWFVSNIPHRGITPGGRGLKNDFRQQCHLAG
jgi:hypothetical protein